MKSPKFKKSISWKTIDSTVVSCLGATALIGMIIMPSIDLKASLKIPLSFSIGILLATTVHKNEIFE
jgi:hypothetical protein